VATNAPTRAEGHLIDVAPVRGSQDRRAFIEFPYQLYRGDPLWIPPLRRDVAHLLSPTHPFHQHAQVELFLARTTGPGGGRVVGRIAAVKNDAHLAQHHDGAGFFGFFETERRPEIAAPLFDAAAAWLGARGLTVMRGPASFSLNEECGLLVSGFDTPPYVMMPHNPSWYQALIEGCGFTKAKDLIAYHHEMSELPERLVRVEARLAARHQITIRTLDMKQFTKEVERVRTLYNAAWSANWGNVPMTDAEFDDLAKQLKPVVMPDLVQFASVRGELAGFALALPDLNVALRHMNGRLLPIGWALGLWYGRQIKTARVLTLGVLPKYRRTGAAELLFLAMVRNAFAHGIKSGESSWILEDNLLMRQAIENVGGKAYKTYRLYDKPIRGAVAS
jgi:GNAT superfamily N-acetyltransferase